MERTHQTLRITTLGVSFVIACALFMPETVRAQTTGGSTAGAAAGGAVGGAASCATLLATRSAAAGAGTAASLGSGAVGGALSLASGIPTNSAAANALLIANVGTQLAVSTGQGSQDVLKCVLDNLAWTVGKVAVQSITRSTVNWVNSGFNGSPAFVTDLQQNLNVLSDTVANNFFQQLNQATVSATGFNLTSPFQDQITQQLRENYYKATGSLLGGYQYDLSNYSSNPQAFLNGKDFSQGGFNAFFAANSNPANNPFGAYQLASNALNNQIDAATQNRKLDYQTGKGFLSWRGNCASANASNKSLTKTEPCLGNLIRTPGSVIEAQLENQLGSGVQQLNLANSMNEIVGALFSQLVNQVLGGGGLLGVSQPSSGGGSSYLSQATNPSQYGGGASSLSTGITQNISNDLAVLATYRDNWQKILDAANAAQQKCGTGNSAIGAVVTQATTGVNNANTAIQQETTINQSIQTSSANTSDPTQITAAITQYQSYLGAATTPSATDEAYAAAQSTDTGTATPSSLYTQMVNAKSSCPTST